MGLDSRKLHLAWNIFRRIFGNVWAYSDISSLSITLSSLFSGSMNGLGDSICTIGSAYFFKRATGDANPFKSLNAFLCLFIFGVLLGPFVSAMMGVSALWLVDLLATESYFISLITWFVGDAVGVLLFTPLVLVYFFPHTDWRYKKNTLEIVLFVFILIPLPFLGYYPETLNILKQQPALIIVPIFFWAALRMNQTIIFNAAAYIAISSVLASYFGLGLFSTESEFQSILMLQLFIIVTISSIFILSSLITEKENALNRLQENYDHDSLTKIFNRQYFDRQLDWEISRQARYGSTFCLIMYDIDFFKDVNDKYGHLFGDKILIQITEVVASDIRDIDILSRWGGEEFMILLPQTQIEGAEIIAERIRAHVEKTPLLPDGTLTISMGLIEFTSKDKREVQLKRLDDALYDAKNSGRNRVKCARTSSE
jgi:diguanylate cyclase (GGDEF)-like protein